MAASVSAVKLFRVLRYPRKIVARHPDPGGRVGESVGVPAGTFAVLFSSRRRRELRRQWPVRRLPSAGWLSDPGKVRLTAAEPCHDRSHSEYRVLQLFFTIDNELPFAGRDDCLSNDRPFSRQLLCCFVASLSSRCSPAECGNSHQNYVHCS